MFSGLRENSLFYVLEKGENPVLRIGNVVSVSNPTPKFGAYAPYGQNMETVVDVNVKFDEDTVDFKQLPANLSIANSGQNGVVVSDSREAMCAEVESMLRSSKNVLDSIDYHQKVVSACDDMLEKLNPQIAKDKEQERKINVLEGKIDGMEGTLSSIQTMLAEALNKSTNKSKNQ